MVRGWINPQNPVAALLFIRAAGFYRAACQAAMAAQCTETFPMVRALLETAGYAAHIHANPALAETWLRRHDDAVTLKAVINTFKISSVRDSIRAADQAAAARFDRLYDDAIDFGGHPNERSITSSMQQTSTAGAVKFEHLLLQGDGPTLDFALLSCARAGLLALDIFAIPFGARLELLGIKRRMLQLRQGL
jgi:hypothetical protein